MDTLDVGNARQRAIMIIDRISLQDSMYIRCPRKRDQGVPCRCLFFAHHVTDNDEPTARRTSISLLVARESEGDAKESYHAKQKQREVQKKDVDFLLMK